MGVGFEPTKVYLTDLKPVPFDRSGIPPIYIPRMRLNANLADMFADLGSSTMAYLPYSGNSMRPSHAFPILTHVEICSRN